MTSSAAMKTRNCRVCGKTFSVVRQRADANRQHCSKDCAAESARSSRRKFHKLKPTKKHEYYRRSRERLGPDGNLKRFYARHPDASRSCQSCGEDRVLDVAHKPGHERKGQWRNVGNTTLDKVWILCPTCHALLDRMGYSPSELGLEEVMENARAA